MTSLGHLFNDFSDRAAGSSKQVRGAEKTKENAEDVRLAAFEEGYQAGWDDAVAAHGKKESRLTDDLVQRFEDLSFTYHEANAKLSNAMKPLLTRFVTKLLPDVMHKALQAQLAEQIGALVDGQSEQAIEVAVSPQTRPEIEAMLEGRLKIPFALTEEAALADGQIYLRVNQTEREINLSEVLKSVSEAVDAFLHDLEGASKNG